MPVRVVRMPDIGEGIAEVEVVEWHVQPGDLVREDQVLAEVMTDKATVEIPSPVAGRVVSLHAEAGVPMAVGADLIRIETGEGAADQGGAVVVAAHGSETAASSAAPAPAPTEVSAPAPSATTAPSAPSPETAQSSATTPPAASPAAPAAAAAKAPASTPATAQAARAMGFAAAAETPKQRPLASPAVRRHARDLGIELAAVPSTGPGGRVLHTDLEAFAQARAPAPRAAAATTEASAATTTEAPSTTAEGARAVAAAAATARPPGDPRYQLRDGEERIPVVGLRRRIAQKMQEAKRRIPHFSYVEEVDVTEVEALRARINERWAGTRGKLTLLPFLVRALIVALRDFPQMNARFDDDAGVITRYGAAHIGIATQTAHGLMVPVLRHAETRDLWGCAAEIARLAEAARTGRATRDELGGSTITITSLGALGGIVSTPVINHPEVAIVGVNRIVERPMIRGGAVVARQMMNLSSSFDHRVIDGMQAAEFVQAIRGMLECPALLFVE